VAAMQQYMQSLCNFRVFLCLTVTCFSPVNLCWLPLTADAAPPAQEQTQGWFNFEINELEITFRYPPSWGEIQQQDHAFLLRGPVGARNIPLEIKVYPVRNSAASESSAWKQLLRAQDQLTRQNGVLVSLGDRKIGDISAPYALVAYPMGGGVGAPVLNVLQFVIEDQDTYYWFCFSGPSDVWAANESVMKKITESIRFLTPRLLLGANGTGALAMLEEQSKTNQENHWTAAEIRKVRKRAAKLAEVPEKTPLGWSRSPLNPSQLVSLFRPLQLNPKYQLKAYQFKEEQGNGNAFVWAMPKQAEFPLPEDCPVVLTHFLQPPKPPEALDDYMEAINGDGSPASYLAASLLGRELREFGALWHGMNWTTHVVLDADPWKNPPPEEENPLFPIDRPQDDARSFQWKEPRPQNWQPVIETSPDSVKVTFYTFSPLDQQRIYRHVDYYRPGSYRFTSLSKIIAEAEGGIAF